MPASAASSSSPRKPVAYQGTCTTPAMSADLRPDGARALGRLAVALLLGADEDRDLAQVLVLLHELVGVGDVLEAHDLPQHRADVPVLDEPVGQVALPRVGEVRAEDLLLAHPQVADVEVEVVARRRAADDDLAERLDRVDGRREGGLADVLEDDVGRVAEDLA